MRRITILTGLALILLVTSQALSGILAVESFDYPVGTSIDTLMGSAVNGWAGPWYVLVASQEDAAVVSDTGLVYDDMDYEVPNIGHHLESVPDTGGTELRYNRYLAQTHADVAGKEYWISFIMQVKNAADNATWLGVKFYNGESSELGMLGKGHGLDKYTVGSGWHGGVGPEVSDISWDYGPVWLVGKVMMKGDGNSDPIYMWINPDPSIEPDTSAADAVAAGAQMDNGFDCIRIEFGGTVGEGLKVSFDEIRLGTTFADVSAENTLGVPITVTNFSFEEPGTVKIKGWDGECANASWTDLFDIPGWATDAPPMDSGVEEGWGATDGTWTGFMQSIDSSTYNLTDHVISAGELIKGLVDMKDNWTETPPAVGQISLYYDDAGARMTIVSKDVELTGDIMTCQVGFNSDDCPASVGKKLGVEINNISAAANSWIGMDNVRLYSGVGATGVEKPKTTPTSFTLSQNYPNPFNPVTNISYTLKGQNRVRLSVYDVIGREVAVLVDGLQNTGTYTVMFSGADLPSGIYLYRLQTADEIITRKMALVK